MVDWFGRNAALLVGLAAAVAAAAAAATDQRRAPIVAVAAASPPAERAAASAWINATTAILISKEFRQNLVAVTSQIPAVWLSQFEGERTPAQLDAILSLSDPAKPGAHWSPSTL